MIMPKLIVTGGSITSGCGWMPYQQDNTWVNRVHIIKFPHCDLLNISQAGGSNEMVFTESVDAMLRHQNDIELVLCNWLSMPRYHYSLGHELYDTMDWAQDRQEDLGINGVVIEKNYINSLKQRFFSLHHLHFEIVKTIRWANIISSLGKKLGIPVYHINDSCPWDENYFVRLEGDNILPAHYTEFTKKEILNIDNRNDPEILDLYKKTHDDYNRVGGVDTCAWINLYDSFISLQTDTNSDDSHPGRQSNKIYSYKILEFLDSV